MGDVTSEPSTQPSDTAKRRKTRGALIEAAYEVFSDHGLSGATIERLTTAAGFTRGAFYSNFDTKEQLMLAVMDRERELATARMSQYIDQLSDDDGDEDFTIEQLTETLIEVLLIGAASRDWQMAIMEALPVTLRDPALAEHQLSVRSRAEADARQLVTQGLDRLERRPTLEVDLLVLVLLGVVERIRTDTLLETTHDAFAQRAAAAIATLLIHTSEPTDAAAHG